MHVITPRQLALLLTGLRMLQQAIENGQEDGTPLSGYLDEDAPGVTEAEIDDLCYLINTEPFRG